MLRRIYVPDVCGNVRCDMGISTCKKESRTPLFQGSFRGFNVKTSLYAGLLRHRLEAIKLGTDSDYMSLLRRSCNTDRPIFKSLFYLHDLMSLYIRFPSQGRQRRVCGLRIQVSHAIEPLEALRKLDDLK